MSVLQFRCWWCRLSRIIVGVCRFKVQYGTSSSSSLVFHYALGFWFQDVLCVQQISLFSIGPQYMFIL